jgi:cob(I)alamin adenosyltransferase
MGSIIVLTGEGKGKTTCALGMTLRAIGHGFKVAFVQFIKGGWRYGELEAAKRLEPEFEIWPMGRGFVHVNPQNPDPQDVEAAQKAWQFAKSKIMSGEYFMVVLDEINYAISFGLLDVKDVIETLRQKPPQVHVVLTGRDAHPELLEMADLVTEMREIKHPFRQGVVSRKGIEY